MKEQSEQNEQNEENKEDYEKYKNKGLTGLLNTGNSCYINSFVAVLSHTYELNEFLNDKSYHKKLTKKADSVLLIEWDKLRELMWSENCTIGPWGFSQAIQKVAAIKDKEIFTGFAQNDLPEFLLFIIDSFHTALMREVNMTIKGKTCNKTDKLAKECYKVMKSMYHKEYSEMLNIFYGIHVSQITSLDKHERLSIRPEPYSILNLSIPQKQNVTLFDCLDLYCKCERLENDNAWYNEKTKKKESVDKGIIFWSLPNILIIDLKRFTNNNTKINCLIDIPIHDADFSKYVKGYNKESYKYDLYGICNHSGGVLGGHYTANVKNANGKWYNYNDTLVKEIPENAIIGSQSYCLFYRKKK